MFGNSQGKITMTKDNQKQNVTTEEFKFGEDKFTCQVRFCDIKKMKIIVYPDLSVQARSPFKCDRSKAKEQIRKRLPWIVKQREYFRQFMPRLPEKRYVSGETFYYLGRQYRLRIRKGSNNSVKLKGKFIWVTTLNPTKKEKVQKLVQSWYREHARAAFQRRLETRFEDAKRYSFPYPDIKLRRMKKRWGSCGNNGSILLNTELVKAPVHCVDYVIMHEICHLKYPKHNLRFYRLLSILMPDWERRKQRLEKVTI